MTKARYLALLVLPSLAGLLLGCGGKMPTKQYYTLVNDSTWVENGFKQPLCERPIVVANVDVSPSLENDRIVYRTDDLRVNYFNYKVWVSPPQDMLAQLLAEKLEQSGIFAAVEPAILASMDHLTLYVRLTTLEYIVSNKTGHVELAMTASLRDSKKDETVWQHRIDASQELTKKSASGIVRALNALYNAYSDEMLQEMVRFVRAYPGCPRTE